MSFMVRTDRGLGVLAVVPGYRIESRTGPYVPGFDRGKFQTSVSLVPVLCCGGGAGRKDGNQ
jgi:hypothetical protein